MGDLNGGVVVPDWGVQVGDVTKRVALGNEFDSLEKIHDELLKNHGYDPESHIDIFPWCPEADEISDREGFGWDTF